MYRLALILVPLLTLIILPVTAQSPDARLCLNVAMPQTSVVEGSSITYVVSLPIAPRPNETLTVTPVGYNGERLAISPTARELNGENWQLGRVFTITALDNSANEPDVIFTTLSHQVTSSLAISRLADIPPCEEKSISVRDNDEGLTLRPTPTGTPDRSQAGIYLEPGALELVEGESATVTVHTNTPPALTEMITLFPLFDPAQVGVSPNIRDVTFSTWGAGRVFSFTAIDDSTREGIHSVPVRFYVTSTDPYSFYFGLNNAATLMIRITDNDA